MRKQGGRVTYELTVVDTVTKLQADILIFLVVGIPLMLLEIIHRNMGGGQDVWIIS